MSRNWNYTKSSLKQIQFSTCEGHLYTWTILLSKITNLPGALPLYNLQSSIWFMRKLEVTHILGCDGLALVALLYKEFVYTFMAKIQSAPPLFCMKHLQFCIRTMTAV